MFAEILLYLLWTSLPVNGLSRYCNVSKISLPCLHGCERAKRCGQTKWGYEDLKNRERTYILDLVNRKRNRIALGKYPLGTKSATAPTASKMHVFSYDKECEFLAGCFLKNCKPVHVDINFSLIGEPVASVGFLITSKKETYNRIGDKELHEAVRGWFNESKESTFSMEIMSRNLIAHRETEISLDATNEFTDEDDMSKLLWDATRYIGCARFYYKSEFNVYYYAFSCVLRPSSVWAKRFFYDVGPPASKCRESYNESANKEYPGLCGEIRPMSDDNYMFEVDLNLSVIVLPSFLYVAVFFCGVHWWVLA